jgi:hypothetical protein
VKNCGTKVHVLVGEELFMTTLSKITRVWLRGFSSRSKVVGQYGLDTIQAWGEAFESRRYLYPHIYGTYTKLRAKSYIKFPGIQYDQRRVPIFLGPISHHEKQFVADYLLENQQMEDIDLLYFEDSDDEARVNEESHQFTQQEDEHEQQPFDPFLGQTMDIETCFSQPSSSHFPSDDLESIWPSCSFSNSNSTPHSSSRPNTWKTSDQLWSLQEFPTSFDGGKREFDPASPPVKTHEQPPPEERESKSSLFDWDEFEPPHQITSDVAVQTDDNDHDKFHFFDDFVVTTNVSVPPEPKKQEVPTDHNQLFMTLDPFQDSDFMAKHEQFSSPRKQLINELDQRLKTTKSPVDQGQNPFDPKDENSPWHSNSFNTTQKESGDVSSGTDPLNLISETNPAQKNSQAKKSSSSYDPSSDPKNRVVFFGTQRIIRREE